MSHKYVRARWIPVEIEEDEDRLDFQITIDLVIDIDTQMISGKHFCIGLYGSPARDDLYPFIAKLNGTVDYGGYCEEHNSRLQKFNGLLRPIRVGEFATYDDNDTDWVMKLVQVQELS